MQNQGIYINRSRNKKLGLFFILGPWLGLVLTVIVYAVAVFVLQSSGSEEMRMVMRLVNVFLGLAGMIFTFATVIGIPVGIYFFGRKELAPGAKYDERSGKGSMSVVPQEIQGWNWGGAGLTWIWGLYHGVWLSLLAWIPFVGIIMMIVLGLKGGEWAWRARPWESVESFKASQQRWMPAGLIFFLLSVLSLVSSMSGLVELAATLL